MLVSKLTHLSKLRDPLYASKGRFVRTVSLFMFMNLIFSAESLSAIQQTKGDFEDKFRQLDEVLPTPNDYRNAAGEPGKEYWQQQVDYKIDITLDEKKKLLDMQYSLFNIVLDNHSMMASALKDCWIENASVGALLKSGGTENKRPLIFTNSVSLRQKFRAELVTVLLVVLGWLTFYLLKSSSDRHPSLLKN